ncbi:MULTISPECIES: hypothetical protein [Cobetia]|uniref:hypothetical protein n=1 Tax=Cobetia TaxID=204286 RepID=UPI000D46092D|nr:MULTISPECIES: hypothetical protein [Cobetia]POR07368.1 hypothetical protein BOH68_07325 [Cobetia sp. MM1IDA2H-1]
MEVFNEVISDYQKLCVNKLDDVFGPRNENFEDPIYEYFRLQNRMIDVKPRVVKEAKGFVCDSGFQMVYTELLRCIAEGEDLRRFRSRLIKVLSYDDDMLSHWGIHHFHLGSKMERDGFVKRTGKLAFIFFSDQDALVLGIYDHASWCDVDLIQVIHDNWPDRLTEFKICGQDKPLTQESYKTLRSKNMNSTVVVDDGTTYLSPGMGVTTNGVSIKASITRDVLVNRLGVGFLNIKNNIDQLVSACDSAKHLSSITIGVLECEADFSPVYVIKETGFRFTLS